MENETPVKDFDSDKELMRNLLGNFGSLLVFTFYADTNQESTQFLENFNNSINIFGTYPNVKYFSVEASRCPQTLKKFQVEVTPTVIFTQTDKKILKRYQMPEDIGTIFDELSIQSQKHLEQFQNDKKIWFPKIESILHSCPVIIFIKGTPTNPKCGFTRTLLGILKDHNVQFTYYDIIEDEYMRYWLRAHSNWPTYPQMYVNGKFVGGLDLIKEAVQKGEFAKQIPESCKTDDPEAKYNNLIKENENIVFTEQFTFENKGTANFIQKVKEKYQNVYVCNIGLDPKLLEWIKTSRKQDLPFLVHKGTVIKME